MTEWRNICCPIDLTEESHDALREAAELARRSGSRLVVVHVLKPSGLSGAEPIFAPPPHRRHETPGADRRLEAWAAEAERVSGRPVSSIRVEGRGAAEILRFAEEQGCDLIVLGKHERTPARRLFRQSIGEAVARHASVPVILVPASRTRATAGHGSR